MTTALRDEEVRLPGGPRLAVRCADGDGRPFVLVHGLASNSRLWDGVGRRLAEAGHEVVAVDLRGHGRSEQVAEGYTTAQCAADLARLCGTLGLTQEREPIVAGQSWGANVVLTIAAGMGGVAALALVDGGWIRLIDRYPTFEQCWAELAPPPPPGLSMDDVHKQYRDWFRDFPPEGIEAQLANLWEGTDGLATSRLNREHHRQILHSLWADDPRPLYAKVHVPTLLAVAVRTESDHRSHVDEAAAGIPDSEISLYVGAHHDLHAQHPDRLARELLDLAQRAESRR